ncbi:hypothetical protein AOQ73_05940 [Bradyrhizobium pachyrhizi]|nr:hypothetical protein AOQ73_05940 [Bradyrhizobium pachyrhizi]
MAIETASTSRNLSGLPAWRAKLLKARKSALTLSAISVLSLPIAGCFNATLTTVTATAPINDQQVVRKARCAGWHRITYSGNNDTFETIWQIRVHNAVGRKKKCWR